MCLLLRPALTASEAATRALGTRLGLAGAAGAVAWALPDTGNPWLTLLLRGGVLTVLYGAGLLLTGWVPEVNAVARKVGWPVGR